MEHKLPRMSRFHEWFWFVGCAANLCLLAESLFDPTTEPEILVGFALVAAIAATVGALMRHFRKAAEAQARYPGLRLFGSGKDKPE